MICYRCGSTNQVSLHESLMGKNRKLSIKYDLRVPLCFNCHRLAHDEPSQEFNRELQRQMQIKFESEHPNESFIKIFGRNYL
jgi:hypothetical protein